MLLVNVEMQVTVHCGVLVASKQRYSPEKLSEIKQKAGENEISARLNECDKVEIKMLANSLVYTFHERAKGLFCASFHFQKSLAILFFL